MLVATSNPDLIVIGGGIVGASIAYHAVRADLRTVLFDARDPGRATDAGAGIIAPSASGHYSDAWRALAHEAAAHYPALVEELREAGEDPAYARVGMLIVAVGEEEAKLFEHYAQRVLGRGEGALREVTREEARARFPPLAETLERALLDPDAARVDGRRFESALLAASEQSGLVVERARVERIRVTSGHADSVETGEGSWAAGHVAIAGGAWTPQLAGTLGVDLPVEPQRGQIAHLTLPGIDTTEWALISALRDHYMVPWPDSRVAVGATRETGSGFDPRATASGVRAILDEALRVAPGLADATLREVRVGLRPLSPDLLPILGRLPGYENLWVATGHGPTGLSLGPYSGRQIVELIRGHLDPDELAPYGPERASLRT